MSRSSRAVRALRCSSAWKDLIERVHGGKAASKPSTGISERTNFVSFLSAVRDSRPDLLTRFCSSKPEAGKSDVTQPPSTEPALPKGAKTAGKRSETKSGATSDETMAKASPSKSESVSQMKEENPNKSTKASDEGNVTSDSSTFVEEDIKKQLKRLTDMLDGFSGGSERSNAFHFHGRLRQGSSSSIMDLFMTPFRALESLLNWFYGRLIQNIMDMEFDINEFLEGAKDAFYIVNHLFEEGDYETLKPMVSTKLYESVKTTTKQFENEGLQFTLSPENILGVYISGLQIVKAKALAEYGPEFDIEEKTEGKENFWILVFVRYARNEHYKLFRSTGEVVQDTTSRRRDLWTFVRGPVNELPMKDEIPGWKLLSIA